MNGTPIAGKIRIRRRKPLLDAPRPRVSLEPWTGFTRHDCPRNTPLPVCPSPHCRRAKACLAAHDNLYCQRTHFSPAVKKKWQRRDPRQRELDAVLPVMDLLLKPPPKTYVERPANSGAKGAGQGRAGDV